jgi:hypothetical protein
MEDPWPLVREQPSPSMQRRREDHWKVRLGLVLIAVILVATSTIVLTVLRAGLSG